MALLRQPLRDGSLCILTRGERERESVCVLVGRRERGQAVVCFPQGTPNPEIKNRQPRLPDTGGLEGFCLSKSDCLTVFSSAARGVSTLGKEAKVKDGGGCGGSEWTLVSRVSPLLT